MYRSMSKNLQKTLEEEEKGNTYPIQIEHWQPSKEWTLEDRKRVAWTLKNEFQSRMCSKNPPTPRMAFECIERLLLLITTETGEELEKFRHNILNPKASKSCY